MMQPKLVLLKGGATTGKSTAFRNLKELRKTKMKEWVFIDHPELKGFFHYLKDKRELQKKALFSLMKQVMKTKKNIILEEMSAKTVRKYTKYFLKKYNYKIITFEFRLGDIKTAYKRNVQRIKNKDSHHKKTLSEKFVLDNHEYHKKTFEEGSIIINTTKLSKKQVVNFILNKLELK